MYADLQSVCSPLAIPVDCHRFYANLAHTSAGHVIRVSDLDDNSAAGSCVDNAK